MSIVSAPWPAGSATGVGSMPGTDADEALRVVFGELPDLPHLPELPARGAGADMIGRTASLLLDLHVDLQPSGWRLLTGGAGHDEKVATELLLRDLEALEIAALGYEGLLKVQVAGPWTLAASLELPRGGPSLGDSGAARDIGEALAEGLLAHVAEVRRRVPGASLIVQVDEPSLPAVLAGHIPTPSGFSALAPVEEPTATERLTDLVASLHGAEVLVAAHCCASEPPLALLHGAGFDVLSVDATRRLDLDALGEAVEAGCALVLGVVPSSDDETTSGNLSDPSHTVEPARRLWRRLGFAPERLGEVVAVSPTCGLAGASPQHARAALSAARATGRLLVEEPA